MNVDHKVMQDAVLQIFAAQEIPAGGHLSLEFLRARWPGARLRRGDLVQAVRQLVFSGELELDEDGDGVQLILTERGFLRGSVQAPPPKSFWSLLLPKKAALMPVVGRKAEPAAVQPRRRSSDVA